MLKKGFIYVFLLKVDNMEMKTLVAIILILLGFAIVTIILLFFKIHSGATGINTITNWTLWNPLGG